MAISTGLLPRKSASDIVPSDCTPGGAYLRSLYSHVCLLGHESTSTNKITLQPTLICPSKVQPTLHDIVPGHG